VLAALAVLDLAGALVLVFLLVGLLLVLPDGRFQLTHRYETWVTYRSRALPPRVDLVPLAAQLAAEDDVEWIADPVDDILPSMAPIERSSLPAEVVVATVVRHLREAPPAFDPFSGRHLRMT